MARLFSRQKDKGNEWALLNDTARLLDIIGRFDEFEGSLRAWRGELLSFQSVPDRRRRIRKELIELRAELRAQGWDLSVTGFQVIADGYKNDASSVEGYRRAVIARIGKEIKTLSGGENHQELLRLLALRLGLSGPESLNDIHFVWYRWERELLRISGADSESPEDFERLKLAIEKKRYELLKSLKDL